MVRRKSKPKAVETSVLPALKELGAQKGIDPNILFDAIEDALILAYKRNFGSTGNVRVQLNRDDGTYHVYAQKTVTEEVTNEVGAGASHTEGL